MLCTPFSCVHAVGLALAVCLAPLVAPGPTAEAAVGDWYEEAVQGDFFKFFNLVEVGRETVDAGTRVHLKHERGPFRPLTDVYVLLDGSGAISELRVRIDQAFVDDPRQGVFARDLGKSALLAGLPEPDREALGSLITEISERPHTQQGQTLYVRGKRPTLPAEPSSGWRAWAGEGPAFEHRGAQSTTRIERTEGSVVLVMRLGASLAG